VIALCLILAVVVFTKDAFNVVYFTSQNQYEKQRTDVTAMPLVNKSNARRETASCVKLRSDRARQRDHIWPSNLQVMYAYSSSCQLRHSQLRHCIVNDVISTGVVWWSMT